MSRIVPSMEKLLGGANRTAGLGRLPPLARHETSRFLAVGASRRNVRAPFVMRLYLDGKLSR
jgi:hypothetical protein